MKQIVIKVKHDRAQIVKETPEQRAERIRANFTYTRVIPNKKKYDRKKFKNFDKNN